MEKRGITLLKLIVCGFGLWGITACSNDDTEGGGKGPGADTKFTIEVSDTAPRGAVVKITPRDKASAYYFDVISEKTLSENYGNDIEKAFRSGLQQLVDRYSASLTAEQILEAIKSVGNDGYTYRSLSDQTKYYVLAAGITTSEIGTTTAVESLVFETTPLIRNAFSVTDIVTTDLTVKAKISSEAPGLPYVTYLVRAEDFEAADKTAEAFIDQTTQEALAYATGLGVTLEDAMAALVTTGQSELDENRLAPAVDYLILTAGVNEEGYVVTEAGSQPVRTAEPRRSDMTFEFHVSELSPKGAVITYIPSIKNDRYFFDIAEASDLEGLTDEQIIAQRIELAGSYIGFYTTYDDYVNDMRTYLNPGTEYVALAFGYISYTTTGLFRSEPFATPSEQYAQDFGSCKADYYGDRFGVGRSNWLLNLPAADNSFTVSINCMSSGSDDFAGGIPAGVYTFAAGNGKEAFSILSEGSEVTLKSSGASSPIVSGKATVTHEQGNCTVTVDVVDAAGHQVKGAFTGTPAATDYTVYPEIGEIVYAQATYYGSGNWFLNLYDYPLQGNPGGDTYYLAFDLYVAPESTSFAQGLPQGTFDVVSSGSGVRDNGYTKLLFDSRKLCDIRTGKLSIADAGDGKCTISFVGSCPLTDIDVAYTGTVKLNNPTGAALSAFAGKGEGGTAHPSQRAIRQAVPSDRCPAPSTSLRLRSRPAAARISDTGAFPRKFAL